MMRIKIGVLPAVLLLAGAIACGGGGENEGDPKDVPGVDASGTADTEIFTDSPDTSGIPVAGQGGTAADSAAMGGGGVGGTGGAAAGGTGGGTQGQTGTGTP